jgi:hypothetical protein
MTSRRDPGSQLPLTPAMFHVLVALADAETHRYAIMKEVEKEEALPCHALSGRSCGSCGSCGCFPPTSAATSATTWRTPYEAHRADRAPALLEGARICSSGRIP